MGRQIPRGWKVIDKYHMRNGEAGEMCVCKTFHGGRMRWTFYDRREMVASLWDDEGGYDEILRLIEGREAV